MAVTFIYALLLLKMCNLSSATNAGIASPPVAVHVQETFVAATQNPISFTDDALVTADIDHFIHKSSRMSDPTNAATLMKRRPKRNSLRADNNGFIRLRQPDTEAADTNVYANIYDREARPDNNGFIRFGRNEPSSVKSNAFIRFGRGGNKGFMRFGRNDETSDIMRFGRRGDKFIRFGRNDGGAGKGDSQKSDSTNGAAAVGQETFAIRDENDDIFRFLRPVPRVGRNDKFIRFGRRDQGFIRFGKRSNGLPSGELGGDEHRTSTLGAPDLVVRQKETGDELLKQRINASTLDEEDPSQTTKDYYDHYYHTNWNNDDTDNN